MDKSLRKELKKSNSNHSSGGKPPIGLSRQAASKFLSNSRENLAAAKRRVLAPINSCNPRSKRRVRKSFSNGNTPSPDKFSSEESLHDSSPSKDSTLSNPILHPSNPSLNFQFSNESLYDSEGTSSPTLNELPENESDSENTDIIEEDDAKTDVFDEDTNRVDIENTDLTGVDVENTKTLGEDDENDDTESVKATDTTENLFEKIDTTVAVAVKNKGSSNKILSFMVRFFSCI